MNSSEQLSEAAQKLLREWPLSDNAIVGHGYTQYMRDYYVDVETTALDPDDRHAYVEGRYRFLFTHSVYVEVSTTLGASTWDLSWDDLFTNYAEWEAAGAPPGFVFGVQHMDAYPGARYIVDSQLAAEWSIRLGRRMHEVTITTNCHEIRLIFYSLRCHKTAQRAAATGELLPIEPESLLS